MATKSLTTEAIALTEKKMDMSLDDIIKMSKTKVEKSKKQSVLNKNRKPYNNGKQGGSLKMRQFVDTRSTFRQGVLGPRRTNFKVNSFPMASESARKAVVAPFRDGAFNRNRAGNWNRPRAAGPMRRPGNAPTGNNSFKPYQQQRQGQGQRQQHLQRGEMMPNSKPKTLDSLFANMKEQRMRAVITRPNNGNSIHGGGNNQPRQPWLRGRFGNYRS